MDCFPEYDMITAEETKTPKTPNRRKSMKFKMVHENYNVFDLQKSIKFYERSEERRVGKECL